MLTGKKTYWLERSRLQHLGFYWPHPGGVFSCLVEVQVVFVLTHLVNSPGCLPLFLRAFSRCLLFLVTCPEQSRSDCSMWQDHLSCSGDDHPSPPPHFNLHLVFRSKTHKQPLPLIFMWFLLLPRFYSSKRVDILSEWSRALSFEVLLSARAKTSRCDESSSQVLILA